MWREKALFFRQLAMAYRAGVPLAQGLAMAGDGCRNAALRRAVDGAQRAVQRGNPLGPSLATQRDAFEEVETALISIGEENGRLDDVLVRLSERSEKAHHALRRFLLALLYPGFLLVAALLLPRAYVLVTQGPVAYAGAVLSTAGPFLLVVGLAVAAYVLVRRSSPELVDLVKVRLPLLGPSLEKLALARFASSLAMLYAGGLRLDKSLRLSIGAIGNRYLEARCRRVAPMVEKGSTIAEALRAAGVFPNDLVNMVAIGERTGDLDAALTSLARFYEEEGERALKALLAAIPIVIYLLVALYIALIVIRFYSGYFKALDGIG